NDLEGSLIFLCSDPFKYGEELTKKFSTVTGEVDYEGTAKGRPVIELTAKESITYALVQNNNDLIRIADEIYPKYMMVGQPHQVDETPFEKYVTRFHANGSTTVGW